MGLGNRQTQEQEQRRPRKWLSIHHGKVELSENGEKQYYSYVTGYLRSIYTAPRTYNGEQVTKWFIDLEDDEQDYYSISFPFNSGTLKSIVLALASAQDLTASTTIEIAPYQKGNFTNVVVKADGVKLDWVTKDLPPVESLTINGRTVKDEGRRMAYISSLAQSINAKLKQGEK